MRSGNWSRPRGNNNIWPLLPAYRTLQVEGGWTPLEKGEKAMKKTVIVKKDKVTEDCCGVRG
jgi:hypothetical protein